MAGVHERPGGNVSLFESFDCSLASEFRNSKFERLVCDKSKRFVDLSDNFCSKYEELESVLGNRSAEFLPIDN